MEASLFMSPPFSPITRTTLSTPSKLSNPTLSLLFFSKKPSVHCPQLSIIPFKTIKCSLSRRPEYIPNRISDPSYIRISDTTLRDGEQAPGACMTSKQKLDVARQLAKLGVDIIEAGFPAAAKDDLEAVKMIAKEVGNTVSEDGHVPVICAFGRCCLGDIEAAWEAVRYAKWPRISMFIATSEIHMKHKLRKTKEEIMQIAGEMVSYARSLGCDDVVFIPEDAGRSDREFLYQILGKVIEAGATTLTIADTVGYTLPCEFGQLIADIKSNTPGIDNVILSTHCHDDLGLSTANSLAGAYAGARQIEVTINGTGERAGNAPLEEVVMAIKCRGKGLLGGLYTGINTKQIVMASKMVAEFTGLYVQPHKSIVGANAFAHASGIHQDGMVKCKDTYQIISPTDIGLPQSNEFNIVLGKLSGRRALKSRLLELGYKVDGKELDDVFVRFKAMAEKKKHISDSDIEALVTDNNFQPQIIWSLGDVHVTCGTLNVSTATVKLIGADGVEHVASSDGIDPIGTAFGAIDLIIKMPVTLLEYSVNAKTEGINAIASTEVVICEESSHNSTHALNGHTAHRTFRGAVAGKDIIVSSIQAYLSALNKMLRFKNISALKISTERVEVAV